jgi:hypothetical protein
MDHVVIPWKMAFFHGLFRWSNFRFLNKSIYKVFGLPLGVNQMWTKKDDHIDKLNVKNIVQNIVSPT